MIRTIFQKGTIATLILLLLLLSHNHVCHGHHIQQSCMCPKTALKAPCCSKALLAFLTFVWFLLNSGGYYPSVVRRRTLKFWRGIWRILKCSWLRVFHEGLAAGLSGKSKLVVKDVSSRYAIRNRRECNIPKSSPRSGAITTSSMYSTLKTYIGISIDECILALVEVF